MNYSSIYNYILSRHRVAVSNAAIRTAGNSAARSAVTSAARTAVSSAAFRKAATSCLRENQGTDFLVYTMGVSLENARTVKILYITMEHSRIMINFSKPLEHVIVSDRVKDPQLQLFFTDSLLTVHLVD